MSLDHSAIFECLDVVYNAADNKHRQEAFQRIEQYQQQLSSTNQLFALISASQSAVQKTFALHCVLAYMRRAWNATGVQDKLALKSAIFDLIQRETASEVDYASLPTYESLCKIVVEFVKREWPQNWPTFVNEMHELSQRSPYLTLSIFLRLSEDVFEFHSVPQQRRKDIMTGLNESVDVIFGIVYSQLVANVRVYAAAVSQSQQQQQQQQYISALRLCKMALETLTALMEWVKTDYLLQEEAMLVRAMVELLTLPDICYEASEAVLLIFEQKAKSLDATAYLRLVEGTNILPAVGDRLGHLLRLPTVGNFEDNFSQRLCQIVSSIGTHISSKLVTESSEIPPVFSVIMELLTFLLDYPSKPIVFNSLKLLLSILSNRRMANSDHVTSRYSSLIGQCQRALIRDGLPSESDACCAYSRTQFNSDEDYSLFFGSLRSESHRALQAFAELCPTVSTERLLESLRYRLGVPTPAAGEPCDSRSRDALEWDALASHCEAAIGRLNSCLPANETELRGAASACLNTLLTFNCHPLIYASVLTAAGAFLPFVSSDRGTALMVVRKMLDTLTFDLPGQGRANRVRSVREMRRHAVCCLLRMCKSWPDCLLPLLADYCGEVRRLCGLECLSSFERTSLIESVALLSNHLTDADARVATVEEATSGVMGTWLSQEFTAAFSDPAVFVRVVGLDRPIGNGETEKEEEEAAEGAISGCVRARIEIHSCLTAIFNVVRACGSAPSAASSVAKRATPNLLLLLSCLHSLHSRDLANLVHSDLAGVFDLDEQQKRQIVGVPGHPAKRQDDQPDKKTPMQRVRNFLNESYTIVLRTIAHALKTAPPIDLELQHQLARCALNCVDFLPDLQLCDLLKGLAVPVAQQCVRDSKTFQAEQPIVTEFLLGILGHSLARLNERWAACDGVANAQAEAEYDEADLSDEVVSEQILRRLTRSFVDLLHCLLTPGDSAGGGGGGGSGERPLSQLALSSSRLCAGLLACLYDAVKWPDTLACQRAAAWCPPLTRCLSGQLLSSGPDAQQQLLRCALLGLRRHGGAGDAVLSALLQLFLCLHECFATVDQFVASLLEYTGQTRRAFEEFEAKANGAGGRQATEKVKREAARRFLTPVIGKPISEQYKLSHSYKNLPPLFKAAWRRRRLDSGEQLDGVVRLFNEAA